MVALHFSCLVSRLHTSHQITQNSGKPHPALSGIPHARCYNGGNPNARYLRRVSRPRQVWRLTKGNPTQNVYCWVALRLTQPTPTPVGHPKECDFTRGKDFSEAKSEGGVICRKHFLNRYYIKFV